MLKHVSRLLKVSGILLMLTGVVLVSWQLIREVDSGIQANESLKNEPSSPIYVYTLNIPSLQLIIPVREESDASDSYSGVLLAKSGEGIAIEVGNYLFSEISGLKTDAQAILTDPDGKRYLYQFNAKRTITEDVVLSAENEEDMILVIQEEENKILLLSFNLILVDGDEAGN